MPVGAIRSPFSFNITRVLCALQKDLDCIILINAQS